MNHKKRDLLFLTIT